ncbi:uncharacterized mitochondrial protein AtMg00860-like [Vicia villosa]|uniref:uncharacterized mitochondrial protein AtMg00860-like n=1 Tax=Vicia villosa TaxID=3911 RepID=UPI00273BFD8E|nr:uncharacterized mitochondrial protein AtMg00860-like [Vicia villosa]
MKKKDGGIKLCVDYRQLNKVTVKKNYPFLRIDDMTDQLIGACVFSKIGLQSDQFGVVLIDDIFIYSKSDEEHAENLRVVLQTLKENKLYVKLSKCEFLLREVNFIWLVISSGGIVVDSLKVNVVLQWDTLKSVTKIRIFMGLDCHYRSFIEGFSNLVLPLTQLTRKGQAYAWDVQCEESFQELKKKLTLSSVFCMDKLVQGLDICAAGFLYGQISARDSKEVEQQQGW